MLVETHLCRCIPLAWNIAIPNVKYMLNLINSFFSTWFHVQNLLMEVGCALVEVPVSTMSGHQLEMICTQTMTPSFVASRFLMCQSLVDEVRVVWAMFVKTMDNYTSKVDSLKLHLHLKSPYHKYLDPYSNIMDIDSMTSNYITESVVAKDRTAIIIFCFYFFKVWV